MNQKTFDLLEVSATTIYRIEEIAEVSGLSIEEIEDLVETCIIVPQQEDTTHQVFCAECLTLAKKARALRDDFQLDRNGMSLAMALVLRIHSLQDELRMLRARFGDEEDIDW